MKDIRKLISLLLIILFTGVTLTSCGDDDDDKGSGDVSAVTGTWYGNDYDTFYSNVYITFYSDGTGEAGLQRGNGSGYTSIYRAHFTFTVKGNTVKTKGTMSNANSSGDTSTMDFNNTYRIDGSFLRVEKGSDWYTSRVQSYRKR